MKKRALSIFLLSILVISCFLYVFPLTSLAETILDSDIAWSIDTGTSVIPKPFIYSNLGVYSKVYNYDASTGWTQIVPNRTYSMTYQMPSPLSSHQNFVVTSGNSMSVNLTSSDNTSVIAFDFNLGFVESVNKLKPVSGDYVCFALPFSCSRALSTVNFSWADIVTGNAYSPSDFLIDERFLVFNPNNISGMTTSGIINTSLWSSPFNSSYYNCVLYCNIPYDQFLFYDLPDSYVPVFSMDFQTTSGYAIVLYEPILFKVSFDGSLSLLTSIDSNVQIISDAIQSHVAPPTDPTDYSTVQNAESQIVSKAQSLKQTMDDFALIPYLYAGLSWVGAYTSFYYNEFGFIQAIYGIIVLFAIANVLRHGVIRTQRDYVTTDDYTVKGHNSKGDYEITGTRTTRRE